MLFKYGLLNAFLRYCFYGKVHERNKEAESWLARARAGGVEEDKGIVVPYLYKAKRARRMENREMHSLRIFQPQQKLIPLTRTRVTRYKLTNGR